MEQFVYARSSRDLIVYKQPQHWRRVAFSCGYLDESTARCLVGDLEEIGRLLQGMMDKAESFCSAPRVPEDSPAVGSMETDDDPLTPDW
jgi:hypothetical protein